MHKQPFNKVTVLGVGLLGASVALALREQGLCGTIHGYGRTEENLRQAMEQGIIDNYSLDAREACEDADLVFLATPVGLFRGIAGEIKDILKKGALVTDVGSVKGGLVYELEALMPEGIHYIGSHPIAGSDSSGAVDARPDLFHNARCIVTPTPGSDKKAMERIISVWKSFGCTVELIDPFRHDEIYAAVSHLPHLAAYALVNTVDDINADYISFAGQGFKDTTRIALSSPEIWRDIALLNRDNLIKFLGLLKGNLEKIETLLKDSDAAGTAGEFAKAQELRRRIK